MHTFWQVPKRKKKTQEKPNNVNWLSITSSVDSDPHQSWWAMPTAHWKKKQTDQWMHLNPLRHLLWIIYLGKGQELPVDFIDKIWPWTYLVNVIVQICDHILSVMSATILAPLFTLLGIPHLVISLVAMDAAGPGTYCFLNKWFTQSRQPNR